LLRIHLPNWQLWNSHQNLIKSFLNSRKNKNSVQTENATRESHFIKRQKWHRSRLLPKEAASLRIRTQKRKKPDAMLQQLRRPG
jgi:hypothetical protein